MADSIGHRGPDDDGYWSDDGVALGFRRLAIVDLETGHQPMANEDGTVLVIFNGEVYNHRELRRELEDAGHRFSTDHSDTEVIVHGYEEWGEGLANRLNGIFAAAIWDSRRKQLSLLRDRLGAKPLYLAELPDGGLMFASEIRALHASGLVRREPNHRAVVAYFHNQNVWHDASMFAGVMQLLPGHMLVDAPGGRRLKQYWDIQFKRSKWQRADASAALRHAVENAIARQIAADVPVMAYLSGGIDSSSIVAGAFARDNQVKAYSCIFDLAGVGDDRIVDEREFSRLVAADLGIDHVEVELPATALVKSLNPTIHALEEPRMGMAYVNYLIAQRVAADSKVVLSGCGGDEMLGGYVGRYNFAAAGDRPRTSILARLFGGKQPDRMHPTDPVSRILPLYTYPLLAGESTRAFTPAFRKQAGDFDLASELSTVLMRAPSDHIWDRLLYADAKTYLSGLLMIEDKLSMIHGLEARVPLLDNEVVDLALTFDWDVLCDGETGKMAFRDAIRDWVPPTVANKPKMGFGPPDASWYRGALQPFVRSKLSPDRIAARGIFEPAFVSAAVESHMSGAANRLPLIWSLLSLEAWCEEFDLYGGLAVTNAANRAAS